VLWNEVSTGSGSDRVTTAKGLKMTERNPVATAPGTDLILEFSNLKVELWNIKKAGVETPAFHAIQFESSNLEPAFVFTRDDE
jgi:hypothetical protein